MTRVSHSVSISKKSNQVLLWCQKLMFPVWTKWRENIFVTNIHWDKMCCWTVRNDDAVDFGGVYEYRRIGESIETGKNIHQFREAAASESQWGSGEKCFRVTPGGLDMFPAASEPHQLDNIAMWGGIYRCMSAC